MPVDMRAKPYYLDDEDVQWVEDTIASMSLEEHGFLPHRGIFENDR